MSILRALTKAPATRSPVPLAAKRASSGLAALVGGNDRTPLGQLGAVGTLFAVVDRCSTAVASVEWDLWQKPADQRTTAGDERTPAGKHAALDLIRQPNPFTTWSELAHLSTQYRKLVGEWFWVIAYAGSIPIEVWPVRPDRMTPVADPTTFLKGWIYTTPDGDKIPLTLDQVIQSKMPNPLDPYRGLGPVQAILTELDSSRYTAEWNRNFFLNSAEPGGIIELPVNLSDTQWEEFTSRWGAQHKGVNNAHRVGVIEYGGKYVPRGYSQRDMEFTALREASRDTIIEAFGISRATLGITDGVNFAAAKAADAQFAKLVTLPELRALQQALNSRLLPLFYPGKRASEVPVEFDFDSPVGTDSAEEAADRTSKIDAVSKLWSLPGVKFDLDALMAAFDLPEIPWEEAAVPLPGQMFGPDGEVLPPPDPSAPGQEGTGAGSPPKRGGASGDDPRKTNQPAKPAPAKPKPAKPAGAPAKAEQVDRDECPTCLTGALVSEHHAPCDVSRGTVRAAEDSDPEAFDVEDVDLGHMETAYRDALDELLHQWGAVSAAQRRAIREQVEAAAEAGNLSSLFGMTVPTELAERRIREALEAIGALSAQQVAAEAAEQGVAVAPAPVAVDVAATVAESAAASLAAQLVLSAANAAVREDAPGRTPDEIARVVDTHLAGLTDRAQRDLLGAALASAQNRARIDTMLQDWEDNRDPLGEELPKPEASLYASEVLDGNTCEPCRDHHGRFVALNDAAGRATVMRLYRHLFGSYVECLGGTRCRGTLVAAWRPATVDEPDLPDRDVRGRARRAPGRPDRGGS